MLILKDHGPRCTVHFTTEQAWMQTFTLGSMEGQVLGMGRIQSYRMCIDLLPEMST